jgi:hypothetical protein
MRQQFPSQLSQQLNLPQGSCTTIQKETQNLHDKTTFMELLPPSGHSRGAKNILDSS